MSRTPERVWQIALLLPQPPLSLLHLLLIRAEHLRPSFVPVIGLALLPLASLVLAARRAKHAGFAAHIVEIGPITIAVLELAWVLLSASMVGFAIALRSG